MDTFLQNKLVHLRDKAIMRAEECLENGNWTGVGCAIDIAKDADHMLRKHMHLEHEHPDWHKK